MPLEWQLRQPEDRHHEEQMQSDKCEQKSPLSIQDLLSMQRNTNGRQEGKSDPGALDVIPTDLPKNRGKPGGLTDGDSDRANPKHTALNIRRIHTVLQLKPRPDRKNHHEAESTREQDASSQTISMHHRPARQLAGKPAEDQNQRKNSTLCLN